MTQHSEQPSPSPVGNEAAVKLNDLGLPKGYQFRDDWEVTPRQVKEMLAQGGEDFLLIDCRTPKEYGIARIEGALLIPLQEFSSRITELEQHRDKKIVVHCHHGIRSLRVTTALRQQGFESVMSMAGGIDVWSVDIDPAVARY